jgi:aminopeptidase N
LLNRGSSDGYDWQMTSFEDTPPMSTYLVAILVSDYQCRKGVARPSANRTVNVSVCTRSNALDELDVALDAAVELSEFFENYYGIEFPLEKLGK